MVVLSVGQAVEDHSVVGFRVEWLAVDWALFELPVEMKMGMIGLKRMVRLDELTAGGRLRSRIGVSVALSVVNASEVEEESPGDGIGAYVYVSFDTSLLVK